MTNRKQIYQVNLTQEQVDFLESITRKGEQKARVLQRANVLLMCYRGKTDKEIMDFLKISNPTLKRLRKEFAEEGLEKALYDAPRTGRPNKFDGKRRAAITGLACTEAPDGYAQWSIRLLSTKAVELGIVDEISVGSVHEILKKTKSSRT